MQCHSCCCADGSPLWVLQAWILNDTVVNNILFGQPFDEAKWNHVVEVRASLPKIVLLTPWHTAISRLLTPDVLPVLATVTAHLQLWTHAPSSVSAPHRIPARFLARMG